MADGTMRKGSLTALDREAERLIDVSAHPDHAEAVRAFIDKREPEFGSV